MKTETYVCQSCHIDVIRPVARGQRPKWCPDCRVRGRCSKRCEACGEPVSKKSTYCSQLCFQYATRGPRWSPLPKRHPVMVAQRPKPEPSKPKRSDFAWRTARECPGCACMFTPLYTPNAITCSKRCSRRVHRWRRRAAEVGALGSWTWSDFMRIAHRFNFHCAYCGEKPEGQLDPDHVVPLSRGGYNSTVNLLPACRGCNGDKRDLLLSEWNADRERRGLPPRLVTWEPSDRRFTHLTQVLLAA